MAHTREGLPFSDGEPLYGPDGHAALTASYISRADAMAGEANRAPLHELLRALALCHDMGKAAPAFQAYLQGRGKSVNHKSAAAKWLGEVSGPGPLLAYAAEGHHSGLPNGTQIFPPSEPEGYAEAVAALPPELRERPTLPMPTLTRGNAGEALFTLHLLTRMLHSALVDADWLATEQFMQPGQSERRRAVPRADIGALAEKLERALAAKEQGATGRMAAIRADIHRRCRAAAEKPRGVYRLNVPTGGGKTLSSLSFALAHAQKHGLSRIIYVIPFTSIIEQTAEEFRRVLGAENVLEHHSNIDNARDTIGNRFAAENWDAPVIVTTSVQFFESLFSATNSRCRKLHNIGNSVIIFDEAQTLSTAFLAPCLAAMKALQRSFACTLLLCTATQPTLTDRAGAFSVGWEEGEVQSLLGAAEEEALARCMGERTAIRSIGRLTQQELIAHFDASGSPSALFIVNLTKQAQALARELREQGREGVYHLSARMCPRHRSAVLGELRQRLSEGLPVLLVATRVVEAGVDISFPIVYRDRCGLDSLAQSAGRCNRHGELPCGQVYAYEAAEYDIPGSFGDLRDGYYVLDDLRHLYPGENPLSAAMVERYFREFYTKRQEGIPNWDAEGILELVGRQPNMVRAWDFPEMERRFRLIPGGQRAVLIPYDSEAEEWAASVRAKAAAHIPLGRADYRCAQQLSVNVYANLWAQLSSRLELLYPDTELYMLTDASVYDADTGLCPPEQEPLYIC